MALGDVCRLCCKRNPLINVFHEKLDCAIHLRYSILLATGIQIKEDDKITKRVCRLCCETVLKMYEYRIIAVANDKKLKEIVGQKYTTPVTDQVELQELELEIFRIHRKHLPPKPAVPSACVIPENPLLTTFNVSKNTKHLYKFLLHPSVRKVVENNKGLTVPKNIFKCDISPIVLLDSTEIQKVNYLNSIAGVNDLIINNDDCIKEAASSSQKENHIPSDALVNAQTNEPRELKENCAIKNSCTSNIKLSHSRIRKRKNIESNFSEVIPRKKTRIHHSETAIKALDKVDLPQVCPTDTAEQKAIFTSSLELRPINVINIQDNDVLIDTTNTAHRLETTGKPPKCIPTITIQKFLCSICNKMYYNKKSLIIHKQKHPKCKFCCTRIKSKELLNIHMNEICLKSIVQKQPRIVLDKVDCLESVVKKYPRAFNMICEDENNDLLADDEFIDYSQLKVMYTTDNNENTQGKAQTDVILLISDDESDNVEPINFSTVPSEPSPKDTTENTNNERDNRHDKGLSSIPLMKENDMLNYTIKKHFKSGRKTDNISQTFIPSISNIESDKHKITLKNIVTESAVYAIPVRFKPFSELAIAFENNFRNVIKPLTLERWDHQRCRFLQTPNNNKALRTSSTTSSLRVKEISKNTEPETAKKDSNKSYQLNAINTQSSNLQPLASKTCTGLTSSRQLYVIPTHSINKSCSIAKTSVASKVVGKVCRQPLSNSLIPKTTVTSANNAPTNLNCSSNPVTVKNHMTVLNGGNIFFPSNTASVVPHTVTLSTAATNLNHFSNSLPANNHVTLLNGSNTNVSFQPNPVSVVPQIVALSTNSTANLNHFSNSLPAKNHITALNGNNTDMSLPPPPVSVAPPTVTLSTNNATANLNKLSNSLPVKTHVILLNGANTNVSCPPNPVSAVPQTATFSTNSTANLYHFSNSLPANNHITVLNGNNTNISLPPTPVSVAPPTVTLTPNLNHFSNCLPPAVLNGGNTDISLIPSNSVSLGSFVHVPNTQYSVANTPLSAASATFNSHVPNVSWNENYNVDSLASVNCDPSYINSQKLSSNVIVNQMFNYPQSTVAVSQTNYQNTISNLDKSQDNSLNQTNQIPHFKGFRVKTTQELS